MTITMSSIIAMEEKTVVSPNDVPVNSSDESLGPSASEHLDMAALEKRVLRKTDMIVLPIMCLVFFFQCE